MGTVSMSLYTISQAALHSGLSTKQIRDYESKGLLPIALRSENGYRLYTDKDLHALFFIAQARKLGFSLNQINNLLLLWQDTQRSSAQVKKLAEQHIAELEHKAQQLQHMANTLRQLSLQCHGDDKPNCPILKGLESP